ncbi:MAG TPA: beta-ketoacyl-ACP synthase II [Thermomicrobiales bacterium]|nr:beta-ketoacyl-[acyl-carrier-protein] synthase II [Chloroflexota bacterium]HQZ88835.1 beta-ketoacyl-ACP synthase II [Thermomicrobiales bacterium]HRA31659.1 beta-ketoacyl-ACP synthase II [Thermomicrobiales bacterium]
MSDRAGANPVVVTGVGCVTPVGIGSADSWNRVVAGAGGVVAIDRFDTSGFPVRIAAQVPGFSGDRWFPPKEVRRTDRYIQLAAAATDEAVHQSGLKITTANRDRVGVVIGSAMGGMETLESGFATLATRGPNRVSPFFVPMMLADMASGIVSIRLGARGPNLATVSACASGAHAIGESAAMIARGDADVVIAGGAEAAITPAGVAGFAAAGALSTRNDDPTHASRPFDRERDGFVLGEGAGILVLESLESALARGAAVLAVVSGYAATADASHIVQPGPEGEGAARSMRLAIERAGLTPADISYINAHGTSTRLNDAFETRSIRTVFGAITPPTSSTKGATGHLLGAAGAVEAVFSVHALQAQTMPPTINYEHPDPECDLDYVPNDARPGELRHIVSNSLGFGGHNVSLVFSAYEE